MWARKGYLPHPRGWVLDPVEPERLEVANNPWARRTGVEPGEERMRQQFKPDPWDLWTLFVLAAHPPNVIAAKFSLHKQPEFYHKLAVSLPVYL